MRDEAIMSIVTISVVAGAVVLGMLLMTIRSIVRTHVLASLKTRCIAAGMSPAEIGQVVLVGEKKCFSRSANKAALENAYPIEKQANTATRPKVAVTGTCKYFA